MVKIRIDVEHIQVVHTTHEMTSIDVDGASPVQFQSIFIVN